MCDGKLTKAAVGYKSGGTEKKFVKLVSALGRKIRARFMKNASSYHITTEAFNRIPFVRLG